MQHTKIKEHLKEFLKFTGHDHNIDLCMEVAFKLLVIHRKDRYILLFQDTYFFIPKMILSVH